MALAKRRWAAELLHVWFHRLTPGDWFGASDAVDAMLRRRFAREWAMLKGQPAHRFLSDPQMALAGVLLFDQIPRNLFRGTAQAFASDRLALAIARGALARGFDQSLTARQRQFLAMPLMHSEAIADQRVSLRVYASLPPDHGWSFAREHHAMIARFGRFPHRNPVLGRRSTLAEERAVAAGFAW